MPTSKDHMRHPEHPRQALTPVKPEPKLDWQAQRELWNAQGKCAIQACQGSLSALMDLGKKPGQHPTTLLLYCPSCTRRLEEAQNITMPRVDTRKPLGTTSEVT